MRPKTSRPRAHNEPTALGRLRDGRFRAAIRYVVTLGAALTALIAFSASEGRPSDARWEGFTLALSDTDSVAVDLKALISDSTSDVPPQRLTLAPADTDSVAVNVQGLVSDSTTLTLARADTDSVAVTLPIPGADSTVTLPPTLDPSLLQPDSTLARADSLSFPDSLVIDDSLAVVDSLAFPDSARIFKYLPRVKRDRLTASLFPRKQRAFQTKLGSYWRHEIKLDSTQNRYIVKEFVGQTEVREPVAVDPTFYLGARMRNDLDKSFRDLVSQRSRRRQQQRRGFGINIAVPGGKQSAFTTIFGKPEVDLRVNGQVNIDAGFAYQKSDQQASLTGRSGRLDPDFGQNIRLGITGSIGDKLRVDVNWDTERTFDFQNQLKLEYTGYEDEIIQKVVAGNVFLQTPSSLIQGGQSLFGIRTDWQLGGLRLTTVLSQQEGESEELSLEGGSETTPIDLKPTDYEENAHFYLAYYFRNAWEEALTANPPTLTIGIDRITDIEVWKLQQQTIEQDNERRVIAITDFGESILFRDDQYNTLEGDLPRLNGPNRQGYELERLRDGQQPITDYLENIVGVPQSSFQEGKFKKLIEGRDYEFDPLLGFMSLQTPLTENEALAVAYRYLTEDGQVIQVGDFANESGGSTGQLDDDRLVLKLLRRGNQVPNDPSWSLMMKNVYKIPGRGFTRDEFELDVVYERPGQPASRTLPGVASASQRQTLLQLLGFDLLNEENAPAPDNKFDFQPYQIKQDRGLLFFPYVEPFAARIAEITDQDQFIFTNLYTQKKAEARRDSQHDVYHIRGEYKTSVKEVYNLGFFGVVDGSVKVRSGNFELVEGADYIVDYSTGTVTITNPAYLTPGRDIRISYERNQFAAISKKTLLGLRADYDFLDRIKFGSTLMRLSEKPLIDKFRVGDEPLSNVIWGLDGSMLLEPRWLTRALDALPLIQTKEASSIDIKGEFAQLLPGHPNTQAFKRTRTQLQNNGRDFKADELAGIAYIDEFESFENAITLTQPGAWRLSSSPDSIGVPLPALNRDSLVTTWRGTLGWYTMEPNIRQSLAEESSQENFDAIRNVHVKEVFPNKDTSGETGIGELQRTFDMYYDPLRRGPYNFNTTELTTCFNPNSNDPCRKNVWAGMMQRIPEGYTDFDLNNVEFVEFIFAVHDHGQLDQDAKLVIDLGSISEDVVPNDKLNTEDGLTLNNIDQATSDEWSRLPTGIQDAVVDVDEQTLRTEDLGFDGLPSNTQFSDYEITEAEFYEGYVDAVRDAYSESSVEFRRAQEDPSGDDYHHFLDPYFARAELFRPDEQTRPQRRFSHFFPGLELNSIEAQREVGGGSGNVVGNNKFPDSEDLNLNATLDNDDRYYQYAVPLAPNELERLSGPDEINDFVVRSIERTEPINGFSKPPPYTKWYVIRIPVRQFHRRVGGISDFNLIQSMRMWITGVQNPLTLRFASLELVGSQWQKSFEVGDNFNINDVLSISAINNEESQNYRIPSGAVRSQIQIATTGTRQDAREQALVLRLKDMAPGDERAVFKTFNQGVDLLKYSNLRMYAHAHGGDGAVDGTGAGFSERGELKLFLRLGLNEDEDYYEYELPLTPSSPQSGDPDVLWQTNINVGDEVIDLNSINLVLGEFNKLKVSRDEAVAAGLLRTDQIFLEENRTFDFAPPGTRLKIRGNPSLSGVTNIVIGVRADSMNTQLISDSEVWVNELRVSGFDEAKGWAALASAQFKLADLATISANVRRQTDGFGGLSSGLGSRETNNLSEWALNTSFNLHKLIPERFGWTLPLTYSIRTNESTPRFAPDRGDIRVNELLAQIDENENLDAAEKSERREEVLQSAQTFSHTRSVSIPIKKSNSRSPILRNTLDAISVNFSASETESRNPSTEFNDTWRWSSSASYRLNVRNPRTFRPFFFLDPVPVLNLLGKLRMSYVPQSVNASAAAQRNFSESKERSRLNIIDSAPTADSLRFVQSAQFPIRETHALSHDRSFGFQYNPFSFLNLGYDSSVNQSLRALGVDTLFSIASFDSLNGYREFGPFNRSPLDSLLSNSIIIDPVNVIENKSLDVVPATDVLSRVFSRGEDVRTDRYSQNYTASFQPRLQQFKSISWLTIQPISYSSRFQWQNGPAGQEDTGANVSNNTSLRGGLRLSIQEFWRKFDFYTKMEQGIKQKADQKRLDRAREKQEKKTREEAKKRAEETAEAQAREDEEKRTALQERIETGDSLAVTELALLDSTIAARPPLEFPEDTTGGGFPLPIPNPVDLSKQLFLALTSPRDLTMTYSSTGSGSSSNVKGGFGLFDKSSPSFRYRLGLDDRISPDDRFIENERLRVSDRIQNSKQLSARTDFSLGQSFRVDLTWEARWDNREEITYRLNAQELGDDDTPLGMQNEFGENRTQSGSNQISVWTFGASYEDFFNRQLNTFLRDAEQAIGGEIIDVNGDGTVLSNQTLVQDFRSAFSSIDGSGLKLGFNVPLPNWSINYTGLGQWPVLRAISQSATLRHSYSATYDSDFRTNASAGLDPDGNPNTKPLSLRTNQGTVRVIYEIPELEVGSVRINERFQPLLGLNVSWKGGIQTDFTWNRSRSYSLSTTNADVNNSNTEDFSLRTTFSKRGLKLPFFGGKKLNNTIRFTLTLSISDNIEKRFRLQSDLEDNLQGRTDNETYLNPKPIATSRITLEPRISYTFSSRVSADFFVRYEQSDSSRLSKTTNIKGGWNIRVNITN